LNAFHSLIEYSRYTVCFDENGAVTNAKAESDSNAETGTREDIWRGKDDEGHAVTTENARKQHVAKLSTRCLYNGCFIVSIVG
jgi:hypothetical protein